MVEAGSFKLLLNSDFTRDRYDCHRPQFFLVKFNNFLKEKSVFRFLLNFAIPLEAREHSSFSTRVAFWHLPN